MRLNQYGSQTYVIDIKSVIRRVSTEEVDYNSLNIILYFVSFGGGGVSIYSCL